MRFLYIIILNATIMVSCKNEKSEYKPIADSSGVHNVQVKEVIQASSYTFLEVTENGKDYWMAVGKTEVNEGEKISFKDGLEMKDFKSKELNRVFDKILLVQNINGASKSTGTMPQDSVHQHARSMMNENVEPIHVEPVPNGITIAELYEKGKKYENKEVIVRGKVVKVNSQIMNRNWVHLKDGTDFEGKSDLTFTTLEEVKVGDIVTLKGVVAIDKKYGAGYVYPLIVEEAALK